MMPSYYMVKTWTLYSDECNCCKDCMAGLHPEMAVYLYFSFMLNAFYNAFDFFFLCVCFLLLHVIIFLVFCFITFHYYYNYYYLLFCFTK